MDRRSFVTGTSAIAAIGCVSEPAPRPATRSYAAPVASIPFRVDYGRRLIVEGMINAEGPKNFIVDTAATTSVVFENAVVSSSVEPSGLPDIKLLGLSGIQQAATFRVGSIDVGGRSLKIIFPLFFRIGIILSARLKEF